MTENSWFIRCRVLMTTHLGVVFGARSEQRAAECVAATVPRAATTISFLSLCFQGFLNLLPRKASNLLNLFEFPVCFALFDRAGIRRLAVGLRAAAKAQEVIIEAFIVRVDLWPTLVANTLIPGTTRVNAVKLASKIGAKRFTRHDFVCIPRHVIDAIIANALRL